MWYRLRKLEVEAEGSEYPGLRGSKQQAWNRSDYLDCSSNKNSKTPSDISPVLKCCMKIFGFIEIK